MDQNNKENNDPKFFQYLFSVNQKVILEYLQSIGKNQSEMTLSEICFLSFIVKISMSKFCKSKVFENERYILIMNDYIVNNLLFINTGSRQIGNMINKLESFGILKRRIEDKNKRYLKVNDFILNGWDLNKFLTNTEKIKRFRPDLWQIIINDFGSEKDFERLINNYNSKFKKNESVQLIDIAGDLYSYLEKCKKNAFNKTKK